MKFRLLLGTIILLVALFGCSEEDPSLEKRRQGDVSVAAPGYGFHVKNDVLECIVDGKTKWTYEASGTIRHVHEGKNHVYVQDQGIPDPDHYFVSVVRLDKDTGALLGSVKQADSTSPVFEQDGKFYVPSTIAVGAAVWFSLGTVIHGYSAKTGASSGEVFEVLGPTAHPSELVIRFRQERGLLFIGKVRGETQRVIPFEHYQLVLEKDRLAYKDTSRSIPKAIQDEFRNSTRVWVNTSRNLLYLTPPGFTLRCYQLPNFTLYGSIRLHPDPARFQWPAMPTHPPK